MSANHSGYITIKSSYVATKLTHSQSRFNCSRYRQGYLQISVFCNIKPCTFLASLPTFRRNALRGIEFRSSKAYHSQSRFNSSTYRQGFLKFSVFCNIKSCTLLASLRRFGGTRCLRSSYVATKPTTVSRVSIPRRTVRFLADFGLLQH
jgi:hypothetical protein